METTVRMQCKYLESRGLVEHTHEVPSDDDEDSDSDYQDEDHVGAEELDLFNQAVNASTESLLQALDEMFVASRTFNDENW